MSEELPTVEIIHGQAMKALATLIRRNRITQATHDTIKPVMDYALNVTKGHEGCSAGPMVLTLVLKQVIEIASMITAYEDHLTDPEHEDISPKKGDKKATAVVSVEDNVTHVDFKGRIN